MSDSLAAGATAPSVIDVSTLGTPSASLWSRFTSWAAEHKTVVYTIAGVTLIVTSAGVVYYLSGPSASSSHEKASSEKRKSKKSSKKAKRDVEKAVSDDTTAVDGNNFSYKDGE